MTDPIVVKFRKLHPDAKVPTKATEGSSGYDLYAL
jgi:dUTPase